MIDLTERQCAERKINSIKEALANSHVDYYICETPYKLCINLKKKFLTDRSSKLSSNEAVEQQSLNTSLSSPRANPSSPVSSLNDSGHFSSCTSCEISKTNMENTRKELIKQILDSNEIIKNLEKESTRKDLIIKNLEKDLESVKIEKNNIKIERNTKIDQLKVKNKALEKVSSTFEKFKAESEILQDNTNNKIKNLETCIKRLNNKLAEKNEEIIEERSKLKKLHSKKKLKSKSTETDTSSFSRSITENSTQTSNQAQGVQTKETFTEYKIITLLNDTFFNEVYFSKNGENRDRSNSFPSCSRISNLILKKTSKQIKNKHSNPNETSWDHIDPESDVANVLNLTRDIAGFVCATARNMNRTDIIEDIMESIFETSSDSV